MCVPYPATAGEFSFSSADVQGIIFRQTPSPLRCKAGYNSLVVDCYGNVFFPCVPWINWGMATGSIKERTLKNLWFSDEYQTQREKTAKCRDCYLNCQTELNLLFSFFQEKNP